MKLNRIRVVLADKGISQTWLAKKLGRSFSTVNAYVCNRSQPNLTTLLEIAQLLSVDMKELITNEKERNSVDAGSAFAVRVHGVFLRQRGKPRRVRFCKRRGNSQLAAKRHFARRSGKL